jgi:hypothetical protein
VRLAESPIRTLHLPVTVAAVLSSPFVSYGGCLCLLVLLSGSAQVPAQAGNSEDLFARGLTWEQFLVAATAQRDAWLKTTASAAVPANVAARFKRVSTGLRILVVAEDWCPDSVNAVPYVARLAAAAAVPLRIVDRTVGAGLMKRHPTPDGRPATPTVVLLRAGDDVAAWVERPGVVQQWFLSMAANPESARRFGGRQSWYESDRGHTVLAEVTALAERTVAGK